MLATTNNHITLFTIHNNYAQPLTWMIHNTNLKELFLNKKDGLLGGRAETVGQQRLLVHIGTSIEFRSRAVQ